MEKVINSYETLFIADVSNGEAATQATVNKFKTIISNNAEIVDVAEWGKRRLAYPINDMNDGYYVVITFKAEGNLPAELERLYKIDESILRSMIIKLEYEAVPKAIPEMTETAEEAAEETEAAPEAVAEAPATENAE